MLDMNIKTNTLIILMVLCVLDVAIPIPVLGLILVYVVIGKPPWFEKAVRDIYQKYAK
jgi:hypothetical protein